MVRERTPCSSVVIFPPKHYFLSPLFELLSAAASCSLAGSKKRRGEDVNNTDAAPRGSLQHCCLVISSTSILHSVPTGSVLHIDTISVSFTGRILLAGLLLRGVRTNYLRQGQRLHTWSSRRRWQESETDREKRIKRRRDGALTTQFVTSLGKI